MNSTIKKTTLFLGACMAFQLGGIPQMLAAPSTSMEVMQQTKRITGTVKDATGMEVIGANVIVKGTTNGVITDLDGKFSLEAAPGSIIEISYIGYMTQEIPVTAQTSDLQITLKEDSQSLDEVVVVGYGVQKKKLVTGATVEVKGDEVAKRNTISPLSALQNQSPGVNIVASSGQPGDGFKVNIRGVGTNGDTAPIYVIDGVAGGDINSLNPADIERIDVLKDAASSAIYGARAANGVILVTTKQGKEGKVQVSYDGNIGWQNVVKMPDMLTAKEYMAVQDQINFNAGVSPFNWSQYLDADLLESYQNGSNPGTNWLELLRNKNAITTSHSVNVTGGSELSKFSTGVGYQYQDGIFGGPVKSDYSRFTIRLNSEHILWKNKDLDIIKFGENVYYQHTSNQGIQIGNQYSNSIYSMMGANPLVPLYNSQGELFDYDDLIAQGSGSMGLLGLNQYINNPMNTLLNTTSGNNKSRNHNLSAIGYIEIQPLKDLKYKGQVYYKQNSSLYKAYNGIYKNNNNDQNTDDYLDENMTIGWNWGMTHTLSYAFDVKENHFDVLVGTEYSREGNNMSETIEGHATTSIFGDFSHAYFNNFSGRTAGIVGGYPVDDHSILSYFGRINYDLKETYMFSAIVRADGSSNFSSGHRWGYFPSFSAGWVMSNESWMENTKNWMDFLKVRASWGQNGNENIGAYKYASTYAFGDLGLYSFNNNKNGGTQGAYPSLLPNNEITWETSEQTNVGLDARFLNGRLNANFDWYSKKTKDLLIDVPVSSINGFSSMVANAGTVKNTGIELALNWRDEVGSDFSYGIGLNLAHNKNEVTEVNNGTHYVNGGNALLSEGTTYMARMEEGHPIGYFWGYKTDGVMQNQADIQAYLDQNCGGDASNSLQGTSIAPGDLKFVDVNGDGVINDSDKTEIGNPHPDLTMGLNLDFSWKGFDLNISTYGAFGMQVAHTYRKFGNGQFDNYSSNVYNYWHGEGTSNRYPILLPGNTVNHINISDIYVDDADYFRIQNVTLGYDIKRLWKSCKFQQLRLYVSAQNLFTFTGYKGMDPECGTALNDKESWVTGVDVGNYPQARTYMVGVNVKF